MTVTTDISGLDAGNEPETPAGRAINKAEDTLREFNRIQPYLTSMAQAITRRRDVKVKLSQSKDPKSYTDGATIFISPYKSFYQVQRHTARLCDRRDAQWQQLCLECKRREELMTFLFHEMAHLFWKSFRPIDQVTRDAKPWVRATWLDNDQRVRIEMDMQALKYTNYVRLAADTGKFLQFMVNVLEDMRIEFAMSKVRANTWDMMTARHMKFLERSNENGKGFYTEFPLNMQITVGLIFLGAGNVPLEQLFLPKIAEDLRDPYVTNFVKQIKHWSGIEDVYENAIDLYAHFIEKGYFEQPTPPPPPAPPSQSEGNSGESKEDKDDEDEDSESNAQSQSEASDDNDDEEGEDEGSGYSGSEETDDPGAADESQGEDNSNPDPEPEPETPEPEPESMGVKPGEGSSDETPETPEPDPESAGITGTGDEFEGAGSGGQGDSDEDDGPDLGYPDDEKEGGGSATPEMGTPEDIAKDIAEFLGHSSDEDSGIDHQQDDHPETELADRLTREEIRRLAMKPIEFANEHSEVQAVARYVYTGSRWVLKSDPQQKLTGTRRRRDTYLDTNIVPEESIYARALMQLKLVFEKNARGTKTRNLKAGKVNANVLGKRASVGDDRLFYNKAMPKNRDYVVLLHLDCSTSTNGSVYSRDGKGTLILAFEKKALYAQAELLHRLRVPFIIMAGSARSGEHGGYESVVFEVKAAHDPWDDKTKARLEAVPAVGYNLDGHAMLIAEWELMQVKSTDKILMYYTDGDMPYANYQDELAQMKRAFATAAQNKIAIMGVGVTTDSPNAHGLDTVRIDTPDDLSSVVTHLGKRLGLV